MKDHGGLELVWLIDPFRQKGDAIGAGNTFWLVVHQFVLVHWGKFFL